MVIGLCEESLDPLGRALALTILTCQYRPVTTGTAARDRLLGTAADLFYTHGIATTGVDRIVADAGVAKPTLYAHFASKAALVTAVLEERHRRQRASLEAWLGEQAGTPVNRLLAVFDWLGAWQASDGRRGCAFLNAAAELAEPDPARIVVATHKRWLRDQLAGLATEAEVTNPAELGEQLLLLVEGANARVLVDGDLDAAARARRAAETLVQAARPPCAGQPERSAGD